MLNACIKSCVEHVAGSKVGRILEDFVARVYHVMLAFAIAIDDSKQISSEHCGLVPSL